MNHKEIVEYYRSVNEAIVKTIGECGEESSVYAAMVARMKADGRYRYKDRGISGKELNRISQVKGLSMPEKTEHQVTGGDGFSEWGM